MQDSGPCRKSAGWVSRRWWEFWESRRDLPESKSWTAGRATSILRWAREDAWNEKSCNVEKRATQLKDWL